MSLNANYESIKDWKNTCYRTNDDGHEELVPELEALIYSTMWIGMSRLTEKDLDEWAFRLFAWESAFGPTLQAMEDDKLVGVKLTKKMIEPFIGLSVNISPLSKAAFKNKLHRALRLDFDLKNKAA